MVVLLCQLVNLDVITKVIAETDVLPVVLSVGP